MSSQQAHGSSPSSPASTSSRKTSTSLSDAYCIVEQPQGRTTPTASHARRPSVIVTTPPDQGYPFVRSPPSAPSREPRTLRSPASAAASRQNSLLRSPSTPSTLRRAIETGLPASPAIGQSTPPSSFPSRLAEPFTSDPLTPLGQRQQPSSESPFDDRHSVVVEELRPVEDEDPFEYTDDWGRPERRPTMPGYTFAATSLISRRWEKEEMGAEKSFMETRPVSEARRSLYPSYQSPIPGLTLEQHSEPDNPHSPRQPPRQTLDPVKPTFRGLFAFSTKRDILFYLVPALIPAIGGAAVQPYMSKLVGEVFDVFVAFPSDATNATSAQREQLNHGVTTNTIKFAVAGAAALALNYAKGALWQRHGEQVADRLRATVFKGVQSKGMTWFDLGMGLRDEDEEEGEAIGAGGLMAKFTRETDDVRIGTALAFGNFIQDVVTFLACFVLALQQQAILALVTLSTVPVVVIIQIITQIVAKPLYEGERRAFAEASTNVERATAAISTVKAHNAEASEKERFGNTVARGTKSLVKQSVVWATSTSLTDFTLLATFVVGFWYGARIVRDGKASPGQVMTVFWACLLGASYLQLMVPRLTIMTKAKNSMASLRTVIQDDPEVPAENPFSPKTSPTSPQFQFTSPRHSATKSRLSKQSRQSKTAEARPASIPGVRPPRCRGEFDFRHVSFAYPTRPDSSVLKDITLFIPPGETTFIVGGSGSGKSTIAQLLLRLYVANDGEITLDNQSFAHLDNNFCKENIAAVQQGCILFDMSIHDNVAMGLAGAGPDPKTGLIRHPEDVTRDEVVEACKMAMIHDFVQGLPEGYETGLGTGGSALSGGQRQRLAIARARIRDPIILILDEATSALDATSRVVVFENIKAWRKNKTTIVITHDLSQIVPDDFVYVMSNGRIVEQGFRSDLIQRVPIVGQETGVFAAMAAEQAFEPLAPKMEEWRDRPESEELLEGEVDPIEWEGAGRSSSVPWFRPHTPSFGIGARPESMAYLDILDEYTRAPRGSVHEADKRGSKRLSVEQKRLSWTPQQLDARRGSRTSLVLPPRATSRASVLPPSSYKGSRQSLVVPSRPISRMSRQPSRESYAVSVGASSEAPRVLSYQPEKQINYIGRTLSQNLEDETKESLEIVTHTSPYDVPPPKLRGLFSLLWFALSTLPSKLLLVLGLLGAILHGVSTPVWSYFLAKLMAIVGAGGRDPGLTKWGLVILALSAAQAASAWIEGYSLFRLSAEWAGKVRGDAYAKVLKQDKGWFDVSSNSPSSLVQILVKDADDTRQVVGTVIGKMVVIICMVGMGIGWAMAVEWRLTLVGVAIAPVFACTILLQEVLVGRAEVTNKAKREDVARTFYESVSNIRGIRAMALDSTFQKQFDKDATAARKTGVRAGWFVAIGAGSAAAIPLFAQALMNWVGARFMIKGYMSYLDMLQVYNLVLFSLTFGSAMLDFIPMLAKAKAATRDFERLFTLSEVTKESAGDLRFPITGHVAFSNVQFNYPSRPDVPVLTGVSFTLSPGECVAIVGPSGSGKSTIAALLQRLYEPTGGSIMMDKYVLSRAEPRWLRNHIAVVSQSANLFDATVAQNIAYGSDVPMVQIVQACKDANIHDFIVSLPQGYDTSLGENASLISGGQAQRLQIARALVRHSSILILDECTSALDVDNQRMILDTIVKVKESRTTIFITHSVEAMRRCDRIICLGDGVVAEDGRYEDLVARGGVFAQLMQTGEWE